MKKLLVLFSISAAITGLSGCASAKPALEANKQTQKFENLDWKGANIGQSVPDWFIKGRDSDIKVQALDEYKGYYCFVVSAESAPKDEASGDDKDWVVNWVTNTANGAARVSTLIAVATNNVAATSIDQQRTSSESSPSQARQGEIKKAMSNASLNNVRQVADFWILTKNLSTNKQYYTASALWIFPAKDVNAQIAKNYQNIIDNNAAMSAAERSTYEELIRNTIARADQALDVKPVTDDEIAEYDSI
jgi:hypothetical protein